MSAPSSSSRRFPPQNIRLRPQRLRGKVYQISSGSQLLEYETCKTRPSRSLVRWLLLKQPSGGQCCNVSFRHEMERSRGGPTIHIFLLTAQCGVQKRAPAKADQPNYV